MSGTTVWTGNAGDGYWEDPANWSNSIPAAGVAAVFNLSTDYVVSLHSASSAFLQTGGVQVHGGHVTLADGNLNSHVYSDTSGPTLNVDDGGKLTIAGSTKFSTNSKTEDTATIGNANEGSLTVYGSYVANGRSYMTIGTNGGTGTVQVLGAHGTLSVTQNIRIGDAASGQLIIAKGGTVSAYGVDVYAGTGGTGGRVSIHGHHSSISTTSFMDYGSLSVTGGSVVNTTDLYVGSISGDSPATFEISGKGSTLDSVGDVTFGAPGGKDTALITATDGATIDAQLKLTIQGTFNLDGTVQLEAPTVSIDGGTLRAIDPPGVTSGPDVVLTSRIIIARSSDATFESSPGTRLVIDGRHYGVMGTGTLIAGGGTVVLDSAGGAYQSTQIDAGTLEIGVTGAAGTSTISFLSDANAILQIDKGAMLSNTIDGFGQGDTLDVRGIAFGSSTVADYAPVGTTGGTLTLSDGVNTEDFQLAGSYSANGFHISADGAGGTSVTYTTPTAAASEAALPHPL